MDEEAVAVGEIREDVLLESKDFALLTILVGVGHKGGFEVLGGGIGNHAWALGLAFNGSPDGREDGLGGEEVDAAVDEVGNL